MACYTFWHKLHFSNSVLYKATQANCAISACCGTAVHLCYKNSPKKIHILYWTYTSVENKTTQGTRIRNQNPKTTTKKPPKAPKTHTIPQGNGDASSEIQTWFLSVFLKLFHSSSDFTVLWYTFNKHMVAEVSLRSYRACFQAPTHEALTSDQPCWEVNRNPEDALKPGSKSSTAVPQLELTFTCKVTPASCTPNSQIPSPEHRWSSNCSFIRYQALTITCSSKSYLSLQVPSKGAEGFFSLSLQITTLLQDYLHKFQNKMKKRPEDSHCSLFKSKGLPQCAKPPHPELPNTWALCTVLGKDNSKASESTLRVHMTGQVRTVTRGKVTFKQNMP